MATGDLPNLVPVRACGDNAEASLVRSLLESRGIPAVVRGENHRSMLGTIGAYIELEVLVPGAQREEALQLLADYDSGVLSQPSDARPDEPASDLLDLQGALCPAHQQPALGTCDRCGAFLCDACGSGEGVICEACEARVEDAATTGDRARRRRRIGAFLLFVLCGGPVLWILGFSALFGRWR